jgi:hypothetical protein
MGGVEGRLKGHHMEQPAHMRLSNQSFHTASQLRFAVGVCTNEGIATGFYAKALQKLPLGYRARCAKTVGFSQRNQRFKIDMGSKVCFAHMIEWMDFLVAVERLETIARLPTSIPVVNEKGAAAACVQALTKEINEAGKARRFLSHGPHAVIAMRAWGWHWQKRAKAKSQATLSIDPHKLLVPALLASDILADRQTVEKLIGDDEAGT